MSLCVFSRRQDNKQRWRNWREKSFKSEFIGNEESNGSYDDKMRLLWRSEMKISHWCQQEKTIRLKFYQSSSSKERNLSLSYFFHIMQCIKNLSRACSEKLTLKVSNENWNFPWNYATIKPRNRKTFSKFHFENQLQVWYSMHWKF